MTVFRGGDAGFSAGRSTVVRGKRAAQDHDVEFGSTWAREISTPTGGPTW